MPKPKGSEHPNLKPLGLIEKFIDLHTQPGGLVLDPFMGSGSTGVAATRMGRRFVGIEIESRWFEAACRRIEDAQRQGRLIA